MLENHIILDKYFSNQSNSCEQIPCWSSIEDLIDEINSFVQKAAILNYEETSFSLTSRLFNLDENNNLLKEIYNRVEKNALILDEKYDISLNGDKSRAAAVKNKILMLFSE